MESTNTKNQKEKDALEFLKKHKTGVLATISPAGHPRARTIYYATDDAFNVYFVTLASTRKPEDFKAHERAAFTVSEEAVPQTVQMEGMVTDLTETATIDPVMVELTGKLMSNTTYFAPLTRFDTSKLLFYRLKPEWIRWGDFTHGHTTEEVFHPLYPSAA
jgi:uncharacterized pyridoxamine 5'-phosphate oxidase family protein